MDAGMQRGHPETPRGDGPDAPAAARRLRASPAFAMHGLFLLAVAFTLSRTRGLLLPVVLAVLADLVLSPLVKGLARLRVAPALGAALVVGGLLGGIGYGAVALSAPASSWMERAPQSIREVERRLRFVREPIERVNQATEQVEKATQVAPDQGVQQVVVKPRSLGGLLVDQTQGFLTGTLIAIILLYFLLAEPDGLLEKVVSLAPRLHDKKRVVQVARRIEADVSRYLLTVTTINLGLGAVVGAALFLLGLPNALLWGALAATANFVPYAGALAMALLIGAVGVLSFDTPVRMFLPALVFLALTSVEAYLVTPTILGRRLTLSPVMVFLSLIVWSWLWGVPGALIAVPLLAAGKIVAQQVPALHPLARLLD